MAEDTLIPNLAMHRETQLDKQGWLALSQFTKDVWDDIVYGPEVVRREDGLYLMYYIGYADTTNYGVCVAHSWDLVHWDKPELGLISYAGNTDNNQLIADWTNRISLSNVCIINGEFVMILRNDVSTSNLVYTSPDGFVWTWQSTPFTTATHGEHVEIKACYYNTATDLYRVYYTQGHFTGPDLRSIGYYDSASLAGPWTNRGLVPEWTSTDIDVEFYDVSFWRYAGRLWACVPMYNKTTEVLGPLRCYFSDDEGTTWIRSTDLLRNGLIDFASSFDHGLMTNATPLLVDGIWHLFYAGSPSVHSVWPRVMNFGLATGIQNPAIADQSRNRGSEDSIIPGYDSCRETVLQKQGQITDALFPRDTWDDMIYNAIIHQVEDGTYRMFYSAYGSTTDYGPATAVSDDLITWTKPDVNIIAYPNGGGTDNNLIIFRDSTGAVELELEDVIRAEDLYVALCHNKSTSAFQLYSSPDGLTWTFEQNVRESTNYYDGFEYKYSEPKCLLFIDGVYRIYYAVHQPGSAAERRSIGYLESTTGIAGAFADKKIMPEFHAADQDNQFYDFKCWQYGGAVWACVPKYDKTTEVLGPLMLYKSDDGGQRWQRAGTLITNGGVGEFDEGLITASKPILVNGKWHMVYGASPSVHSTWPRVMDWGLATGIQNPAIASASGGPERGVAYSNIPVLMVLAADHVTPAPGLVPVATVSLDGGAFGATTGIVTEVANGMYQFDASAADMAGDLVTFRFAAGTADDTFLTLLTS